MTQVTMRAQADAYADAQDAVGKRITSLAWSIREMQHEGQPDCDIADAWLEHDRLVYTAQHFWIARRNLLPQTYSDADNLPF